MRFVIKMVRKGGNGKKRYNQIMVKLGEWSYMQDGEFRANGGKMVTKWSKMVVKWTFG